VEVKILLRGRTWRWLVTKVLVSTTQGLLPQLPNGAPLHQAAACVHATFFLFNFSSSQRVEARRCQGGEPSGAEALTPKPSRDAQCINLLSMRYKLRCASEQVGARNEGPNSRTSNSAEQANNGGQALRSPVVSCPDYGTDLGAAGSAPRENVL